MAEDKDAGTAGPEPDDALADPSQRALNRWRNEGGALPPGGHPSPPSRRHGDDDDDPDDGDANDDE